MRQSHEFYTNPCQPEGNFSFIQSNFEVSYQADSIRKVSVKSPPHSSKRKQSRLMKIGHFSEIGRAPSTQSGYQPQHYPLHNDRTSDEKILMERMIEKHHGTALDHRKKQHKDTEYAEPHSHLEALPGEIIERIALNTSEVSREVTISNLGNLRLCSRAIEAKTRHAFIRVAFQVTQVDFNFDGLSRLQKIADDEDFRKSVQTLILERREISIGGYETLEEEIAMLSDEQDREHAQKEKDCVDADSADRDYLETSGAGAALLTRALSALPNVIHVHLEPVNEFVHHMRYDYKGQGKGTSNILMTCLITALAASGTRPISLTMPTSRSGIGCHQGVFPHALTVPKQLQSNFDRLQEVKLILTAGYDIDKLFLLSLPALKHLDLILDEIEHGNTTHPVGLTSLLSGRSCASQLETLSIEGANMNPNNEADFLRPHASSLKRLTLKTCNLRFVQLSRILDALKQFTALQELTLHQISENCKRVSFSSQGFRSILALPESLDFDGEGYVLVDRAQKYTAKVEGWEDMAVRLQEIQDALEDTDIFYGSDSMGIGVEWWDVSERFYNLPY